MAAFDDIGRKLHDAQRGDETARLDLFRAREQLERSRTLRRRVERYADAENPEHRATLAELDRREGEIKERIGAREAARARAAGLLEGLLAEFLPFTDPRENLGGKSPDFPFLLFPVRLETRFKQVADANGQLADQLWVRIYPDDCLVDTFEDTPSESEIQSLEKFWVDWVAAGGNDDQQRGAWRSLVAGSGAGRSAWLLDQYAPDPSATYPEKGLPTDVVLVVATRQPLPATEKPHVETFWKALWLAADDAAAQQAAYAALEGAIGADRAAVVFAKHPPRNLAVEPTTPLGRADVGLHLAFLELPDATLFEAQRLPWSQAPRVRILPERFVLLGYNGGERVLERLGAPVPPELVAGPDPLAEPADQMHLEKGDLVVGDAMKWMVDFDEAVRVGMGFRVDLSPVEARRGFDQLMVVGVRLSADEGDGKQLLETLFHHHEAGNSGLSLLPQGTATNNVEGAPSGYSEEEDSDDTYETVLGSPVPLVRESEWLPRSDGQWLAEMLGIDLATFDLTPYSRGRDQCEARAMNTALWPATWGYFMESMMGPVFSDQAISHTRWFFNHFVTARGTVPAIRIADQPYGILPTTVFSRASWLGDKGFRDPRIDSRPRGLRAYLVELERLLGTMRGDWERMSEEVSFVGKAGDPHQILLDVLGLHAASAEYYQRYAESLEQLTNRMKLQGFWGELLAALTALGYTLGGMQLLRRLGATPERVPEILEKFFLQDANKLLGELIDDQELSEVLPIRAYTGDGRNYLRWLIDSARTSFDTLRREEGFADDVKPRSLLYLLLRYALEQSFWDSSLRLFQQAELLSATQLATARLDPSFVHVADAGATAPAGGTTQLATSGKPVVLDQRSESRYEFLYQAAPAITGDAEMMVADFIPSVIGTKLATAYLSEQLEALEHLVDTPTARLERLLAEHVDLCTYRLDAWRWGLLNYQLAGMRYGHADGGGEPGEDDTGEPGEGGDGEPGVRSGIYLGAFGWLTDVRSERKQLTPVELEGELDKVFNPDDRPDLPPLVRDSTNGGFVHAPSLNHAITAAILRNGYLANATPANPETLKVNLSSERVRLAMGVIEGIRNGQKLGALLGYQLERGLHDRHAEAEVDKFIYDLRKAFPLVADRFRDTVSEDGDPIEAIEARNVVDGFALVNHIKESGLRAYPFGKNLPAATPAEAAVINSEVDRVLDVQDAVADLVLAESVYQTVQGNFSRVASTLDAYARGTFPPEPEVAQTPRSGTNLTHRLGVHLEPGLDPTVSPNAVAVTPRAFAEPALNKWLNGLLPDPGLVFCKASYLDPATGTRTVAKVTQQQLGLQPADLLYLVNPESEQAMAALDDLVVHHVLATFDPRWDGGIEIEYAGRETGEFSFFEVGAILRPLRGLVLKSRPLAAGDVTLPNEATEQGSATVSIDAARLSGPAADLGAIVSGLPDDLDTLLADLALQLADTTANRTAIIAAVDGWIARLMALFSRAARFALQHSGIGFAYDWKRRQFALARERVQELVDRWQASLAEHDALIATDLPAATTDEERYDVLRRAEGLVSTELTIPIPATPAAYQTAVAAKRATFAGKLGQFEAMLTSADTALSTLLQAVATELPLDALETVGIDVTDLEDEVVRFAEQLHGQCSQLRAEAEKRRLAAGDQIAAAAAAGSDADRVAALQAAAKTLFGEDFKVVPEFALLEEQAGEWQKAWNDSTAILTYLTAPDPAGLGIDFPVDEWLYGVARVREETGRWERVTMLARALGRPEPALTPIQLPHRPDDRWLALPHPPDYEFDGERLLYTAHYAVPFDKNASQCGLLLDEWTEVIPTREETTGVTFHYDRPSTEPPQTLLLVTSPQMRAGWAWNDLVDAIRETFDEARVRTVEPAQVDDTAYARFLPATIGSVTRHPITIMLNLALNNRVYDLLEATDA